MKTPQTPATETTVQPTTTPAMTIPTGYWSTSDMMARFRISRMTLNRWMKRKINPLPKPVIVANGSENRWSIDDVVAWENSTRKAA